MKIQKRVARFKRRAKKYLVWAYKNPKKYSLPAILAIVATILFLNVLISLTFYSNKSMPNLFISGIKVSSLSEADIQNQLAAKLESINLTFDFEDEQHIATAGELGLKINEDQLKDVVGSRSFKQLLMPWLVSKHESLPLTHDSETADKFFSKFKGDEFKTPVNASFSVADDEINIKDHVNGVGIDSEKVIEGIKLLVGQDLSDKTVSLEASEISPEILKSDIENAREIISQKLSLQFEFIADNPIKIPKSKIAELLTLQKEAGGSIRVVSDLKAVEEYVDGLVKALEVQPTNEVTNKYLSGRQSTIETAGKNGRKVSNTDNLINELVANLDNNNSSTFEIVFEEIPFESVTVEIDDVTITATYTYDVQVWGAVGSNLPSFKVSAKETLANEKGWSGAGISFAEVNSGGSFTLVLASPDRVASISSGCSASYSCRVGRYVIINDQRWQTATPSWNGAGGSLRDYRHMVVNHEVGHWLGFGHRYCGGAGQLAPVMQQQSIDLQGCKFNPWPTISELNSV